MVVEKVLFADFNGWECVNLIIITVIACCWQLLFIYHLEGSIHLNATKYNCVIVLLFKTGLDHFNIEIVNI